MVDSSRLGGRGDHRGPGTVRGSGPGLPGSKGADPQGGNRPSDVNRFPRFQPAPCPVRPRSRGPGLILRQPSGVGLAFRPDEGHRPEGRPDGRDLSFRGSPLPGSGAGGRVCGPPSDGHPGSGGESRPNPPGGRRLEGRAAGGPAPGKSTRGSVFSSARNDPGGPDHHREEGWRAILVGLSPYDRRGGDQRNPASLRGPVSRW